MAERLTVIIVAVVGGAALRSCIEAVRAQTSTFLVANSDGAIVDPGGKTLGMAERRNIPSKRQKGIELASTPLVALIEDTVRPFEGWVGAIEEAFQDTSIVGCGGPVIRSRGLPAFARALALSDFGKFGPERPSGPAASLPGCNFAFRRDAVLSLGSKEGLVDQIVFERLQARGGRLWWVPNMRVDYTYPDCTGARLTTRFHHGRIYGGLSQGRRYEDRAAAAAKSLLLPLLLTVRSLKRASRPELMSFATLGWLLLQHTAWAAGEFTGATFGVSKEGLDQWH